jgi:uncharacterized protein
MHAASTGHVEVIKALLAKGADIKKRDDGGHTALMFAANNGQRAAATVLADAGADIDARNRNGHTASDYAATNGHKDIVELLQRTPTSGESGSPARATGR